MRYGNGQFSFYSVIFAREFSLNLLFCALVGLALSHLNENYGLTLSMMVSLGYGVSVHLTMRMFAWLFPRWPLWLLLSAPMLLGVLIGTLHAYFQFTGHVHVDSTSMQQFSQVFVVGLLFSVIALYILLLHKKQMHALDQLRQAQIREAEQARALALSQLKQLQSQIEPHFLFNTLASIQVLIKQDPAQAGQMLRHLTALLRTTLQVSRSQETTLNQELALVQAYLSIHQLRMGPRLRYSVEIKEQALMESSFPALLLQPIVENAIKHGIEPALSGGEVSIEVTADEGCLRIRVADTGIGISDAPSSSSGEGVGLENIRARLARIYAGQARLTILENTPHGVVCTLEVPYER